MFGYRHRHRVTRAVAINAVIPVLPSLHPMVGLDVVGGINNNTGADGVITTRAIGVENNRHPKPPS